MAKGTADNPHTYPQGVTCWIDAQVPDAPAAAAFYGELLGWQTRDALPPEVPASYLVATLDGHDVAAIEPREGEQAFWLTYVAVDDVDAMVPRAVDAGATLVDGPHDAGPGGRWAELRDPEGAVFRMWQARNRLGSQLNNAPGAWNFSDLHTTDVARDLDFYREVFGWEVEDMGPDAGATIKVPGYGDHLEATVDPDIRVRQAGAPEGFADAIGGAVGLTGEEHPHWHVTFSVADRDAAAQRAESLGASVVSTDEGTWARTVRIRDPWGAELTLSQFVAPG
ncbi:VOC family protein [Nocardioides hwasunensis]|uniref:VOC family protein n=1 Tax=Nocardioides hwasunensis TaxID=397258 RepID=A0ABR8MH57_9ACTN|nr:VOC family protein [Nocardioides hwasunensis]MBD3914092.1 VOC family protein [Nocardioides hwasunensis]